MSDLQAWLNLNISSYYSEIYIIRIDNQNTEVTKLLTFMAVVRENSTVCHLFSVILLFIHI